MSGIVVERGIPVPGPDEKPTKYPWRQMEPGDSFFVPCNGNPKVGAGLSSGASHHFGVGNYRVKRQGDGFRVWRVR